LLALTAGPGMLHAANLLAVYPSSSSSTPIAGNTVAVPCNTASGPGTAMQVWVRPLSTLTASNIITVGATTVTGTGAANVVLTAPGSLVLNASNSATGIEYTVSLASVPGVGCAGTGLGSTSVTFNFTHIAGTTSAPGTGAITDIAMGATVAITSTTSGLTLPGTTVQVTCIKTSGGNYYPGPAVTVSAGSTATGGTPFSYDSGTPVASWLVLAPTAPSGTATSGSPVTFTVQAAGTPGSSSGCDTLASTSGSNTATTTIHLLNAPGPEQTINVQLTVSPSGASPLVPSPTSITVTCAKNGSVYTPNIPQTISISAPTATAFTIDSSVAPYAAWLAVTPITALTATSTIPAQLSLQAIGTAGGSNCGGGIVGSSTSTVVHLVNAPAADKLFTVIVQIVTPGILQASPAAPSLTYVKGSGTAGYVDVAISSTSVSLPSPFFTVNTATLPSWLRLDSTSGTAPKSLRFSSTSVADTIAPGVYTASVAISVSGYGDLNLSVTMLLTNTAPQLTVQAPTSAETCASPSATTFCIPWIIGQALPTPTITAISTDTPIAYTATTGGLLAPVIAAGEQSGLAYSFGTPINLTFGQQAFASAQPGNTLTGTLTLTWGNPVSTVVVTFQVEVQSPGATILSHFPSSLPVEAAGGTAYSVTLSGSGFVYSTDPTQETKVGVVTTSGSPMNFDSNIHATVINQSTISVSITIPAGSSPAPYGPDVSVIPFNGTTNGGAFTLGVCNPVGGACTIATSSVAMTIGTGPIIQAVTSSSSLLESSVALAPYDMISIFGTNFCPNCLSTQVLTGSPDPASLTYPTQLQFNTTGNNLSVTFSAVNGTDFTAVNAPLLFATNNQINLLVPSVVLTGTNNVDIVVNYGPAGSLLHSAVFPVSIAATDPGIFTIGADGQGSGAALDSNFNLISATNPAGVRLGSGNSDIVQLYMTGLGAPDSTADNTTGGTMAYPADCLSVANYLTAFDAADTGTSLSTLDGTLIIPSVLTAGRLQPCILPTDITHLYIGGVDVHSNVMYAGWVGGTIAGLYQINVKLPVNTAGAFTTYSAGGNLTSQSITAPVQVPVQVVMGSYESQAGVNLWIKPSLKLTGPNTGTGAAADTMSTTVGTPLPPTGNAETVVSGQGVAPYTYSITSGLLPAGLSMATSGGSAGQISGTPAAGTENGSYTVTVTATDSSPIPITGTDTFVVTVGNGLFLTETTPVPSTFGTIGTLSTVTASNGLFPYTYPSLTITGFTLPTGMAINSTTGAITTSATTPAGSYLVVAAAQDSTSGSPITGSSQFTVAVNLHLAATVATVNHTGWTTPGAYNTMATLGGSATYTYALDPTTQAFVNTNSSWLSFDPTMGVLSVTAAPPVTTSFTVTVTATDTATPTNATAPGTGSTTFAFVIGS